jgi:hypothetical protein
MPVTKQLVPVDLTGGLNTKTDSKSLQPGQLKDLRNGVYTKGSRVDKRFGYDQVDMAQTIFSETIGGEADGIATYQDELLVYADQHLYSYAQGANGWVDKGKMVSGIIKTRQIIKNSYQQTEGDMAIAGEIALYAWQDTSGNVRYSIEDLSTGTILANNKDSGYTSDAVKCVALDPYLFLFIRDGADIQVFRLLKTMPALQDMGKAVTDLGAATAWDTAVIGDGENIVLVYKDVSSEIRMLQYDADMNQLPQELTIAEDADVIAVTVDSAFQIFIGWSRAGVVRIARANRSATLLDGPVTAASETATHIALGPQPVSTVGQCIIAWTVTATPVDNQVTRKATYTLGAISTAAADLMRSVRISAKGFTYQEQNYIGVIYTPASDLQPTFFIVRMEDGQLVGKQQYREAGAVTTPSTVSRVGNAFHWMVTNKTRLISEGDTEPFSSFGQSRTSFDFGNVNVFNTEEMGRSLFISGGILQQYDGAQVTEFGFALFPEPVTTAIGAAGVMSTGTHFIKVVYEWTDANGQIHYSAPSIQESETVTNESIDVTVATLRVTNKSDITVSIFMTEAGGEIFYRATSVTSPLFNDPTVDTVAFNINISDGDLIDNDILYTTGGVLENTQPPAATFLEAYKGRLVLTGLENPVAYWYSKINQEGVPIEFTDVFSDVVESKGGDITAVSTLDDKLLLWKRDRPYYIYGDGPNASGAGAFTIPEQINVDVGCSEHVSIVRMPDGLMFKSVKGIYTMSSGFGVQYVGAGVEDFNGLLITGAVLNPDTNEVRYVTEGRCLVYNYYFQRWSTFDNFAAKGAVNWINTFAYVRSDGTVFLESETTNKDNGSPVGLYLETGWMSFGGIQGFQRVSRFAILGTYKTRHILRIRVGYDFEEFWRDSYYFDTETQLAPSTYGDASPYGEVTGEVYGGNSLSYFFRAHLSRQKCSSIRFSIEDVTTEETGSSGEGFDITGLALDVGLKGKIARRPYLKSIGAN